MGLYLLTSKPFGGTSAHAFPLSSSNIASLIFLASVKSALDILALAKFVSFKLAEEKYLRKKYSTLRAYLRDAWGI